MIISPAMQPFVLDDAASGREAGAVRPGGKSALYQMSHVPAWRLNSAHASGDDEHDAFSNPLQHVGTVGLKSRSFVAARIAACQRIGLTPG